MKGLIISCLLLFSSIGLFRCESPCSRTVSQSKINAVDQTQLQLDITAIDSYLDNEGITAMEDPTGIRYTIDVQGSGPKPCIENNITIKYKGNLMSDGTQFDISNFPVSYPLNNLILGWQIIMPKVQAGSKVTLYIPSGFGYGSFAGNPKIPANSNLIFEIELIK